MGILYIVPTPVGNMEDMTFRAIRILKEVDLVLAEDTRTSGILLKHYEIKNSLMSHHKFNEHGTSAAIVNRLLAGENVALIRGRGTVLAWGYGFRASLGVEWTALRPFRLRRFPATEERSSDKTPLAEG